MEENAYLDNLLEEAHSIIEGMGTIDVDVFLKGLSPEAYEALKKKDPEEFATAYAPVLAEEGFSLELSAITCFVLYTKYFQALS